MRLILPSHLLLTKQLSLAIIIIIIIIIIICCISLKYIYRDVFVDFCHQAHLGVHVEVGSNLTPDGSRSRPADVLVRDWITGRFAAFDFTVSSPLSVASLIINQACITSGFAALSAETRKHKANDPKCSELGWVCVPLAVETYGNWGKGLGTHFPV